MSSKKDVKMIKVRYDSFAEIIKKLRECMRANKALNAQNKAVNAHNKEKGN